MNPMTALRMEQKFINVPADYPISGKYYWDKLKELQDYFADECCESARGAAKAEKRLNKFQLAVMNIQHAAATVLRSTLSA